MNKVCPFCDKRTIQKQKYFESDYFVVLVDSRPITYAHSLIVPRRHFERFSQLNQEEATDLLKIINALTEKLLPKLSCTGYNLLSNNGASAGQTVNHAHLHFIPRREKDRKEDFKNLCFPTEKDRSSLTKARLQKRTSRLSKELELEVNKQHGN